MMSGTLYWRWELGRVMNSIDSSWGETLILHELHVDRNAFEDIVNAVADLPIQRRGRRAFVFSHRERVLFLHAFLAFGLHVAHMLLLPIIKSPSEVNVVAMWTDLQGLRRELRCSCPLPTVSRRLAGPGGVKNK